MVIVIMGESGSGKRTIGTLLAEAMGCHFYDGHDFQPPENVEKMAADIPLTSVDLRPWLVSLRNLIEKHVQRNCKAVIACTPLQQSQQMHLRDGLDGVEFVFLNGSYNSLWSRVRGRKIFGSKVHDVDGVDAVQDNSLGWLTVNMVDEPPIIVDHIVSAFNIVDGVTAAN